MLVSLELLAEVISLPQPPKVLGLQVRATVPGLLYFSSYDFPLNCIFVLVHFVRFGAP